VGDRVLGKSALRTLLTRDLRTKLLVLVLASALIPLTAVGLLSYFTARGIILDNVYTQLIGQADTTEELVRLEFDERAADTEIFATAQLVQDSLERWRAGDEGGPLASQEARQGLERYLEQIRERYPLYRSLLLLDGDGHLVTRAGNLPGGGDSESLDLPLAVWFLDQSGAEPILYLRKPVTGRQDELLGHLYSVSGLEELWRHMALEARAELGRVRVVDPQGAILFDSLPSSIPTLPGRAVEGARLCRSGRSGIAEYWSESGEPVLGTCHFLADEQLGLLVEVKGRDAFAASRSLRNTILSISMAAAAVTAGLAWFFVAGIARPVDSLIAGAKAVSEGELSHRIQVTSKDQTGYLTHAFNRMTQALQESQAKLEKLSGTDELTGLMNRRHLAKAFQAELNRVERSGAPLSLLMVDLDHFKDYNDRWGHLEGDEYLQAAGAFLQKLLRPSDVIARYGGEEFLALMPGTTTDQAAAVAERIRQAFTELQIGKNPERRLTVSIGVAGTLEDGSEERELIEAADRALYLAKKKGRNRVVRSPARSPKQKGC
jgi:diguanylate cyclase (GGDEF)-like protein